MSTGARRAAVVVLDACGAGALPDAAEYGDAGADTLVHVADAVGGLRVPNLQALGLGSIRPLKGVAPAQAPALHGRLHPLGPGKDSATGHWELMGAVPSGPLPTYPSGFPADVLDAISARAGRGVCLNGPSDGMTAIDQFGTHHLRTGELIVYTSADSVLQVAAHADVLPEDQLQALCRTIRTEVMIGEHAVGRVIARPFEGPPEAFRRTEGRKDFAIAPPGPTFLDALREAAVPVHAVGKINDLFGGRGISEAHPGASNALALERTSQLWATAEEGLIFTNLIETDQVFGHRKDVEGFAAALEQIDAAVGVWVAEQRPGDLLVITADHGVDPTMPHHDHTREHAPLLGRFAGDGGRRHDGPLADVGASVLHWLTGTRPTSLPGSPFA